MKFLLFCPSVPVAANSDYSYSKDNDKAHEAGYDAYMTGLSFISLTTYLGQYAKNNNQLEAFQKWKNISI